MLQGCMFSVRPNQNSCGEPITQFLVATRGRAERLLEVEKNSARSLTGKDRLRKQEFLWSCDESINQSQTGSRSRDC
ncbi:hypothetical protein Trydic_g20727 [Trypoxylus dichotomus]